MERESGSNNGTPRFRPVRLFGVEITLPENGDNPQQPTELQVHSLTISQISNLRDINSFGPDITRDQPFHSSITSGTMVVEQPEVAALPPPSPPHSHPHQPTVPPPQNATMEGYANNPLVDAGNLQRQVENGLREATGGNIDPDMVDAVIQLIVDTLESLEDNADHDDILNVHLSIQLEEVMEDSLDEQEDHPGLLSEEVIMSLLGTSTFETSYHDDEDKDSCCICLDEFSTGDELGKINCEHKFHFMCIREWLKRNNICPICRAVALSVS
ncbi:E3 ubiquitin-protein ligase RNF38-like [Ipomoea triloba]|uniref:E3 ubiquitin-protein ligase RNF38-like n=1 Tax=Ipomoea triloba TaxID=35885 RepID=UPI00125DC9DA|nr:E3 ubiquitin-protein ligase RNF38-like [Ipomoea triloba]